MFSFLSIEFAICFIIFYVLYWLCQRYVDIQNILLTVFSYFCIYLMSTAMAVGVLFLYSLSIYMASYGIDRFKKHQLLIIRIAITVSVLQLCLFKYFDFFKHQTEQALFMLHTDSAWIFSDLIMPLGLSYYSFQSISYLVDRTKNQAVHPRLNFLQICTYFSLLFTITAGPIARVYSAKGLNAVDGESAAMGIQLQNAKPRQVLYPAFALFLIVLALVKKWWLASWIASAWVNPVFENPLQYQSFEVLAAIYGYTIQLFLDFSGYSELMLGLALLLGFKLPINFKAPLLAYNIRDFWDRWHISLSTWIRDYIYIPLGGSRGSFARTQAHLLLAMILSGIWHGAGWGFVIWGALHGLALIGLNLSDVLLYRLGVKDRRNALANTGALGRIIGRIITIHFVCFAFVFFQAKTLQDAKEVFQALTFNIINVPLTTNPFYFFILLLISWIFYPWFYQKMSQPHLPASYKLTALSFLPLFIVFVVVLICAPSGIPGFIYANF